PSAREDAAGVKALALRWPVAAEVGFGWAAIGPLASVQRATGSVRLQVPASRDHLGLEGEITRPGHLTQIRGFPGSHQCLESPLPPGTHDFDLEITAAGAAPGVIRRPAGRGGAGVVTRTQHRKLSPGER